MFLLVSADVVRLWTSALFMLVVGMGNAVNMTSQRLMIHDRVGASYGPTAMAVEPLLSGGASMIASFGAGVLVDFVGHAAMFGVLGALALGCVVLTLRVPRSAALTGRAGTSGGQAIRPKRLVQTMPAVAVLIAVTITTNLCVLGYQPLVPKLAERFSSSATLAGSLTAAAGFGQLLGGVVIAARVTRHRLVLLLAGSATTILGIAVFGLAANAAVAFAGLFVAGLGQSAFSAMQSVLAVEPPDPAVRLAVLGTVTTAVGAMPVGMVIIGGAAEWLGARGGALLVNLIGLGVLAMVAVLARLGAHPNRRETATTPGRGTQ
jgi:hypothetical protein